MLTIPTVIWVAMAVVTAGLALYRKFVSREEVDVIHLRDNESAVVSSQETFAHRLDAIDRWGKILTIALIAYGVVLACGYLYFAWQESSKQIG
jgi:putative heme iron utilization protein